MESMQLIIGQVSEFASNYLMILMSFVFVVSLGFKVLMHYLAKSYHRFCKEFQKRVHRHLEEDYEETRELDFSSLVRSLLEKTYYEAYILREERARRNLDKTNTLMDRVFLVEQGVRRMVMDTLKKIKYFSNEEQPNFTTITKFIFGQNIFMNSMMAKFPIAVLQQFFAILPGLFVIGGIFGTFLGIVHGIPELKNIDPQNLEVAKQTMGIFLDRMAFSMNTSLVGISFSVVFTVLNQLFSEKRLRRESMEMFYHGLEFLWQDANVGEKISLDHNRPFVWSSNDEDEDSRAFEASSESYAPGEDDTDEFEDDIYSQFEEEEGPGEGYDSDGLPDLPVPLDSDEDDAA